MSDVGMLEEFLAGARVDAAVFALRPDYRALLLAVDGIAPGPGDQDSDALLLAAEAAAREALSSGPAEQLPHVAAWREAYRAFGAKPQRTRNSLEALLRRAASGLPRVNRLTDIYNAVSVLHQIPLGGEDLTRYTGPPRLLRAAGDEPFDTTADGLPVTEHPEPGEVIWCDAAGVTCRLRSTPEILASGLEVGVMPPPSRPGRRSLRSARVRVHRAGRSASFRRADGADRPGLRCRRGPARYGRGRGSRPRGR